MRVSLRWLHELVPGLPEDSAEVASALLGLGLEVEAVHAFGAGLERVRVAEVVHTAPHPSRDRLRLVTLRLEQGREQTVVCGAANVPDPGGLVVLAPLGTHLGAVGITLEPREIGGVTSEGMLCSERELGLAAEAEGILTFEPGTFEPGTAFYEALPFARDTVFELGITPNRPDALGHLGVARDLAARFGLRLVPPVPELLPVDAAKLAAHVCVENRAPELCPRYGAAVVQGVRVGPSPAWLRYRLHSLGIRPISNVVDVTNLILLEYGNPMHAFDLDRVRGNRIIVRAAASQEPMTTLDGAKHQLVASDLVIADAALPSALGGIMGGQDSEIRPETEAVLLECAYFEPTAIRKTARRLGLQTDSSYRFERGVDFAAVPSVLSRAAALLAEFASGRPVPAISLSDGELPELREIPLRSARLDALLGMPVDFERAKSLLVALGFEKLRDGAAEATFRAASFRPDVTLEADLIEEVARTIGLDALPTELPPMVGSEPVRVGRIERECRRAAVELGLFEAVNYSFVSRRSLALVGAPQPVVTLKNPFSEEREVMTTSLLPGLLDAALRAQRHGEPSVALFTVGSVFLSALASLPDEAVQRMQPRDREDLGRLPEERATFALVLLGDRPAYLRKPEPFDVYDAKGMAFEIVRRLTGQVPTLAPSREEVLHPRSRALLLLGERVVGRFGTLHPDTCDTLGFALVPCLAELDLVALEQVGRVGSRYAPVPRLPAITRDLALEAPDGLEVAALEEAIASAAGDLCESVRLFDVFRPAGGKKRSLAFRVVYRDPKATTDPDRARTLTDKEVEAVQARVLSRVTELGALLRG
jgi:phenylalanyl-tRNA synthetase beta chain